MVSSSRPCKSLAARGQPAPTCRARGHRRSANRGASGHAQQKERRAPAHLKKQLVEPGDIAGPPTGGRPDTRSRKNVARRRISRNNLSSPGTSPVRQPGGVRTRAAERTSRAGASQETTCRARGHRRSANRGASGHAQQKERRAPAHLKKQLVNLSSPGTSPGDIARQPGGVRTRAAGRTSRAGAFSLDNILTAGCSQSRMRAARALRPPCRVAAALRPARTIVEKKGFTITDPGAPIGAHKRFQLVEKTGFTRKRIARASPRPDPLARPRVSATKSPSCPPASRPPPTSCSC